MTSYNLYNVELGLYLACGDGPVAPVYGEVSPRDAWETDIGTIEPYLESKLHTHRIPDREMYLHSLWKLPDGIKEVEAKELDNTSTPLIFVFAPTGISDEYYISVTGTSLYLNLSTEAIHPACLLPNAQAWIVTPA
jgi:hypothetical protein